MICSLGSFVFEAHDVTDIEDTTKPHFGIVKPMGDNPHYHATQGSERTISIAGRYIASSNSRPMILQQMAEAKSPVRFTTASGQSIVVVITDFKIGRKNYLPYAGAVEQDFSISMARVGGGGGGFDLFSILGAILAIF